MIHCQRCGWSHEPPMQGGCEFENCQYDPAQQKGNPMPILKTPPPGLAARIFGWTVAGFLGIVALVAALATIGLVLDNGAERATERNNCLKHATNGYAIEQCR